MAEEKDLQKLEQEAFRISMKDGIIETLAGYLFFMVGIIYFNPAIVGVFVIFYVAIFPRVVKQFRERETYPRIGYAKLKTSESNLKLTPFVILIAIVAILAVFTIHTITGDVYSLDNWLIFIPFTFGLLMFGPSIYLIEKSGSKIYWLFGGFTTTLGLAISYLWFSYSLQDYMSGMVVFFLLLGPILMFGGLIKIQYFLRKYPIIEQQEDEVSEQ